MNISVDPLGGKWWGPAGIALLCFASLVAFWVRGHLSPRRKALLVGLRLCLTAVLLGLVFRPSVVGLHRERLSGVVVFLIDQSRSMTVVDGPQGQTRDGVLRKLLETFQPRIEFLSRQVQLQAFCFGDGLSSVPIEQGKFQLPVSPVGNQSPIGWALEEVLRRQVGQRLLAVVLLSDGAQRGEGPFSVSPLGAAAVLARNGVAVHTVAFGEPRGAGRFVDVAVERLVAPDSVLLDNEVIISADIHAEGFAGANLPLEVLLIQSVSDSPQVVATTQVQVPGVSHHQQVLLRFTPQSPGEFKLVVRVPAQPGEAVLQNNERATILRVLKGGIRALVVEGFPPRPEAAFLRRALSQGAELQVHFLTIDPLHPEGHRRDLEAAIRERDFQVYMLGNVPASAFPSEILGALAAKVLEGSGLIMLGGMWSFGPGGYADGPLAELLPVRMSHLETQGVHEPPRGDVHISGPIQLRPTAEGTRHPLLEALAADQNSGTIWGKLPPLDGINKFVGLKPAAQVLLESTKGHPVLVYQPVGAGRVLVFAGDSTWRWAMGGFRAFFERFWRQVVIFTARREGLPEGELWIKLADRVCEPGKIVTFELHHELPNPKDSLSFSAQITAAPMKEPQKPPVEGSAQVVLEPDISGTHWQGRFGTPDQPGDYFLEVVAKEGPKPLATARARFLVAGADREMEQPAADVALLQRIAALTGGTFVRPEEFDRLVERLGEQAGELELTLQVVKPLWDRWPWLVLALLLVGSEWYLRRRWGMV